MEEDALVAHPTMLVLARESRGRRQQEVAEAMSNLAGDSISQGYVSKAEAGRLKVNGERLNLYARALGYPAWVLCTDPQADGIGIGLIHHRKRASMGAPALRRIHAELTFARHQVRRLVDATGRTGHRFEHLVVDDLDSPADAARTLRQMWSVPEGPIADLVAVIEEAGGLVLVRNLGTNDLDAVSQWSPGEAPLFLLNDHAPGDRFRFSLSHELGHVVMHSRPDDVVGQERQADEFASEFLMPAADMRKLLHDGIQLHQLVGLKQRWGVSMAALIRRALGLGVISDWQYRNLMIEMSGLGYRVQEPGGIVRESASTAASLVAQLGRERGYTPDQAADLVGLLPDEFRTLYLIEASDRAVSGTSE